MTTRDDDLHVFVEHRYVTLRRTAYLMCGDWGWAEDLVQIALARLLVAHRRRTLDNLDAYLHTILARTFLTENQRSFRRREAPGAGVGDGTTGETDPTLSVTIMEALRRLPPRQRATVVLRYWQDMSTEATAQILGVSTGTVKSQCAKALATLRVSLSDLQGDLTPSNGGFND